MATVRVFAASASDELGCSTNMSACPGGNRLSATAERLWSNWTQTQDNDFFGMRLHQHRSWIGCTLAIPTFSSHFLVPLKLLTQNGGGDGRCRTRARGIGSAPVGLWSFQLSMPNYKALGWCPSDFEP